jgi:hypothetical protein
MQITQYALNFLKISLKNTKESNFKNILKPIFALVKP